MFKNNRIKVISIISILLAVATIAGVSLSWLPGVEYAEPYVDSAVLTNYFESGKGTATDPFIIHTPRHLYNLAWLQYMGQFNKPLLDASGNPVKDAAGNIVIKQCYFKVCAGTCPLDPSARPVLDMGATSETEAWVLPPIGNKTYPFVGHFDGNGVVIKNAKVSGMLTDLTDPAMDKTKFTTLGAYRSSNGCDIVGLFGVIGSLGETAGIITKDEQTYSYTVANNEVTNVPLDSLTVVSGTEKALAGAAAGYVNGNISTVRMAGTTIDTSGSAVLDDSITTNISNYSSVGYTMAPFKNTYQNTELTIGEPSVTTTKSSATGIGNNWGGSLDMRDLLNTIRTNVNWGKSAFPAWRNNGGTRKTDGTVSGGINSYAYFYQTNDDGKKGAFTLANGSGIASGGNFAYLSGGMEVINGYEQKEKEATAYIITDGKGNYVKLEMKSSGSGDVPTIVNEKDEGLATRWTFPAGFSGAISTVVDNVTYYLNADLTNKIVTASTGAYNNWRINQTSTETGKIIGTLQAEGSYSVLFDGLNWSFQNVNYISSYVGGQTHYLGIEASVGENAADPIISETKTQWIFEDVAGGGWKIYTYYKYIDKSGETPQEKTETYYLTCDTATELMTLTKTKADAKVWKQDTAKLYCSGTFTIGSASYTRDYYIDYEGKWIVAFKEYYAFTSGDYQLGVKSGPSGPVVTNAKATWDIYNNTVSIRWNGDKYFLCSGTDGALKLVKETSSISPTAWAISDTCLRDTSTGKMLVFIQESVGWQLLNAYTIAEGSAYLGATTALEIVNAQSYWFFVPVTEGGETYYYICTNIARDTAASYYYLTIPTTGEKTTMANTMTLQKTPATKWQVGSNSISATLTTTKSGKSASRTYYLYYHGICYTLEEQTDYSWRVGEHVNEYSMFYNADSKMYLTNADRKPAWPDITHRKGSTNKYDAGLYKFEKTRTDDQGDPQGYVVNDEGNYLVVGGVYYLRISTSKYEWKRYTKAGDAANAFYLTYYKKGYSSETYRSITWYAEDTRFEVQNYNKNTFTTGVKYRETRRFESIDRTFNNLNRTVYNGNVSTITKTNVATVNMPTLSNESDIVFIITKQTVIERKDHFWDYNRSNVTYIPMRIDTSGNVLGGNTGYILGGSQSKENGDRSDLFPYKSGDVRFGRRTQSGQASIGSAYVDANNKIYNSLTIGAKGQASVGSNTYPSTMFQKYSIKNKAGEETGGARPGLTTILQNSGNYVYGLHFMEAELSSDYLITTTKATVEHATFAGYEMPNSCVDFQLQAGGFINFFAGTYYRENTYDEQETGERNNAFFSLHQIIRYKDRLVDSSGKLILSVLAIYTKSGDITIYKCNDGDFYKLESGVLKKVGLPTDFDTIYTQLNTKVFMHSSDVTKPLYYLGSDGTYYSWTSSGIKEETALADGYIDAMKVIQGAEGQADGVREIAKIFAMYSGLYVIDASKEFIYQYADGGWSKSGVTVLPSGDIKYGDDVYQLAFNTDWLTNPTAYTTAFNNTNGLYYFEIPTNRGEYALGSVKGKIGAYLVYLDVSANASTVGVQTMTEVQNTQVKTFEYPKGVQFAEAVSDDTSLFSDIDSAAVALTTGSAATITRTENTITYATSGTIKPVFAGNGVSVTDSGGTELASIPLTTTEVREEKELHYMQSDGTATDVTKENFYILYKEVWFNNVKKDRAVTYVEPEKTPVSYEDDGRTLTAPTKSLLEVHAYQTGVTIPTAADTILLTSVSQYAYSVDTDMTIKTGTMVDNVALTKSSSLTGVFEDLRYPYYLLTNKIDAATPTEKEYAMKALNVTTVEN